MERSLNFFFRPLSFIKVFFFAFLFFFFLKRNYCLYTRAVGVVYSYDYIDDEHYYFSPTHSHSHTHIFSGSFFFTTVNIFFFLINCNPSPSFFLGMKHHDFFHSSVYCSFFKHHFIIISWRIPFAKHTPVI